MLSARSTSALVAPARTGLGLTRGIASSAVVLAKKKEIDPSLPTPPRGPASAYTLFVKKWFTDNRSTLLPSPSSTTGKLSMKEIAKQMGTAWSELTETAKAEYTQQAKDLKVTYNKEYKSFLDGLSDDSIKAIEGATGKKLRIPGGKAARKREISAAEGGPRKPMTAFFEFMQSFREKEGSGMAVTEVAKQAGDKWRNMSEDDKQHWRELAASNKAKFDEWHKSRNEASA